MACGRQTRAIGARTLSRLRTDGRLRAVLAPRSFACGSGRALPLWQTRKREAAPTKGAADRQAFFFLAALRRILTALAGISIVQTVSASVYSPVVLPLTGMVSACDTRTL
jgi:hypothetical protein